MIHEINCFFWQFKQTHHGLVGYTVNLYQQNECMVQIEIYLIGSVRLGIAYSYIGSN